MTPFGKSKKNEVKKLGEFAASHLGVEAYFEPPTSLERQSLLLVARDGDWARAQVAGRGQAAALCKKLGIPLYDAALVGYPERYRGIRGEPAPDVPSTEELEKWFAEPPPEKLDE